MSTAYQVGIALSLWRHSTDRQSTGGNFNEPVGWAVADGRPGSTGAGGTGMLRDYSNAPSCWARR